MRWGLLHLLFSQMRQEKKIDIQMNIRSYKVRANAGIASKGVTESVYILTYVL